MYGLSALRHVLPGIALVMSGWVGAAPATSPQITIVDGEATVVDGARRFTATAGQRVGDHAIIETGARLAVLRVEWPDGTVADFGPDTRAMLAPGPLSPGKRGPPAFYLLQGWAKQSSLAGKPSAGQTSSALQIDAFHGVAVGYLGRGGSFVFVESGNLVATDRNHRGAVPVALKAGEVYTQDDTGRWAHAPRPTTQQLKGVPPGFRSPLPLQAERFAGSRIEPPPQPAPTYAELEPWLTAERALRAGFPRRFATLARDPAFKKSLHDNLAAHPEWESVLHPERSDGSAAAPARR